MNVAGSKAGGDAKSDSSALAKKFKEIISDDDDLMEKLKHVLDGMNDSNEYENAVFSDCSPYQGGFDYFNPKELLRTGQELSSDLVIHIVASYLAGSLNEPKFTFNGVQFEIVDDKYHRTLFCEEGLTWIEQCKDAEKLPDYDAVFNGLNKAKEDLGFEDDKIDTPYLVFVSLYNDLT